MIRGSGDKSQNLVHFKRIIRKLIGSICDTISVISFRYQTHPDAIYFNRSHIEYLLAGGDDVAIKSVRCKGLVDDLLLKSTPNETHLSLLHAKDIGCHNPQVDSSALELHSNDNCTSCVDQFPTKMNNGIFNPFHCWRRGHLSHKIGFVLHLTLSHKQYKDWGYDKNSINLFVTRAMLANLNLGFTPHIISKSNRQMVVTIRIKSPDLGFNSETHLSEIQQLLAQQLLISKTTASKGGDPSDINFKEVPDLVYDLLKDIEISWKKKSHSLNTNTKHLDLLMIHNSAEDLVDELKPKLQQFHSGRVEIHKIGPKSFTSDLIEGIEIAPNYLAKGDAMILLCLDPIIDLGVRPFGNR
jgi:hypothetical protein